MPKGGPLRATIDRIERDQKGRRHAVLVFDDGQQLVLPLDALPPEVRAGQVLRLSFQTDVEETARRAEEIRRLQQDLFGS